MIEILDWIGRFTTLIFLLTIVWAVYAWFNGILPAMIRLGNGLAKRKIVIFAKGDNFDSLKDLLIDSRLFNEKNIVRISKKEDMKKAARQTLFLIYWPDWQTDLSDIIQIKVDSTALIVYAPQEHGFIPKEQMTRLNEERNVVVTNFRGRLLNDVIVSMISTGYEQ